MSKQQEIILQGRIFLQMDVHVVTGLHIGGAAGKLEIGGVDSPVIRDPITNRPYMPGSSLRGKMRSLSERLYGKEQNFTVNSKRGNEVKIHTCQKDGEPPSDEQAYDEWRKKYRGRFCECEICSIYGATGDSPVPHPTALIVRDTYLSKTSVEQLAAANTDLPYTEVKWEATIDRVTSAATPRQIERVPAGAVFSGLEMIYSVYESHNLKHLPTLLQALTLVEEDYLGGLGSRGSGKVRFVLTKVSARKGINYQAVEFTDWKDQGEHAIDANRSAICMWVENLKLLPEAA